MHVVQLMNERACVWYSCWMLRVVWYNSIAYIEVRYLAHCVCTCVYTYHNKAHHKRCTTENQKKERNVVKQRTVKARKTIGEVCHEEQYQTE